MKNRKNPNRLTYLISLALLLVLTLILLPQAGTIAESLASLKHAKLQFAAVGLLAVVATYFVAGFALDALSLKPLQYSRTLLVQFASGFTTKLVPAGIGGFATNARYLTKSKHTVVQASSVMVLNGLLGFLGHVLILLASTLFVSSTLSQTLKFSLSFGTSLVLLAAVSAILTLVLIVRPLQQLAGKFLFDLRQIIKTYRRTPFKLLGGFIGACGVTALFSIALYLCALSLDVHLNFLQVMLVYTAGSIGTAVMPTPGGIGGAEAALSAALIAIGTPATMAVSVAILFRLIAFWIPIIPGFICFQWALRRQYI